MKKFVSEIHQGKTISDFSIFNLTLSPYISNALRDVLILGSLRYINQNVIDVYFRSRFIHVTNYTSVREAAEHASILSKAEFTGRISRPKGRFKLTAFAIKLPTLVKLPTLAKVTSSDNFQTLGKMSNLSSPVADDRVELVDDEETGIKYRLRKCGRCRLIVISLIVLLVIGVAVAVAVILTRGM